MAPSLARSNPYGVALVGEALGEDEARAGAPFVGRAGFKLTRLLEWAGLDRSRFDIWNAAWCQPPSNQLEGQPYEYPAIDHCRQAHWGRLLDRVRVVVPMGNVPLHALSGKKRILTHRGYIIPGPGTTHLVPTVHPSFIQRGQSKYSAAFIHDVQKAVQLAETGLPVQEVDYLIDPLPRQALEWARLYRAELQRDLPGRVTRLAYDIETPGKGDDEGESELSDGSAVGDRTYFIWRIGFSYKPGHALTVPWTPEYIPAIRLLLESDGEKVVWNAGFDNPRIRHAGVGINGVIHDGMVAWHILHSDLPKGLGFVATFTCPFQPPWKHLSTQSPGFYNATDADVELKSMIAIEEELRKAGLWEVYERDVVKLDPILHFMTEQGMPIDEDVRYDRASRLAERQTKVLSEIESRVPIEARRYSPKQGYTKDPENVEGCVRIVVPVMVKRCEKCGLLNPTKPHRDKKTIGKPGSPGRKKQDRMVNPCLGAGVVEGVEDVARWARLDPFKPSREQLIRYQELNNRIVPTIWDKKLGRRKVSMDEKSIKTLMGKYPLDPIYPLVLEYRAIDKLAGTYVGRPNTGEE